MEVELRPLENPSTSNASIEKMLCLFVSWLLRVVPPVTLKGGDAPE